MLTMLRVEHDCELNVKEHETFFFPHRGPFRKLLDCLRHSIMISETSPSARRYLRSKHSIVYEKRRHLRNFKEVIHPFSLFRHWWDIMMIFVLTICLLVFPYQGSFNMATRRPVVWSLTKNILHSICFCDIVVNLMTGYYNKTQRFVEMKKSNIIRHYICYGTFIPDLLGSIPTDLLSITPWKQLTVAGEFATLIIIFRFISVYCYIEKTVEAYDIHQTKYGLFSLIFWATIIVHWEACLFWMIPFVVVSFEEPEIPKAGSWIHYKELMDKSTIERYCLCVSRVIVIFTRSGFEREEANTTEDQCLIIVFQLMAILIFCILIVRFMQYFQGIHSSKLKYQAATAQLKQYMMQKQLPKNTQRRFINYYEFRFQYRYFREGEILNTLSGHMRQEISMHSCRKLVENVTFFNNLPLSLLSRIVALLKSEVFLTNDVIVRANTSGDCMYFIATGTVAIYTQSGKEVCHLEDGAHFGEIALVMPDEKRVASVVAVEICELYRLERADFAKTIHPYPMLWERIKKIAMDRHEKTIILNAQ